MGSAAMRLPGVAWRNLWRRPLRSSLALLGVANAVASYLMLVGTASGIERGWTEWVARRGVHAVAVRRGAIEILAASIDESLIAEAAREPGVAAATGELVDLLVLDGGQQAVVRGWPSSSFIWSSLELTSGRLPRADAAEVVLGADLAERLDVGLGGEVRLNGWALTVCGIAARAGAMERAVLAAPLATLQRVLDKPGKVTALALRLEHPEDEARVTATCRALEQRFPTLSVDSTAEIAEHNLVLRFLRAATWGIGIVALLTGCLIALNAMLMAVTERTAELALLSAIGWPAHRILSMVLLEGAWVVAVAALVGTAVGTAGLKVIAAQQPLRGLLEPNLTVGLMVKVGLAALAVGLAGGLYPAWRATRLAPATALRHE